LGRSFLFAGEHDDQREGGILLFGFEKQSLVLAFAFASAFTLTLEWSWVGKVRVSGRRLTSPLTDKRYGVGVPVTISGLAVFLIDCAGPGMPHADGVAKVMKEEACPTANASSAVPLRAEHHRSVLLTLFLGMLGV